MNRRYIKQLNFFNIDDNSVVYLGCYGRQNIRTKASKSKKNSNFQLSSYSFSCSYGFLCIGQNFESDNLCNFHGAWRLQL